MPGHDKNLKQTEQTNINQNAVDERLVKAVGQALRNKEEVANIEQQLQSEKFKKHPIINGITILELNRKKSRLIDENKKIVAEINAHPNGAKIMEAGSVYGNINKIVSPDIKVPSMPKPATVAPVDVENVKATDKRAVTEKDKDVPLNRATQHSDLIWDYFANETMLDKLNKHRHNNNARNNIRGNLNGKSFEDTLALSRKADAFNNRLWYMPGRTAMHTRTMPGVQGEIGQGVRLSPIETQEMRQMRANERIDENARTLDNQFQYETNKFPLDLQRRVSDMSTNIAQTIGTSDVAVQQAFRLAVINNDYNLPTQTRYQQLFQDFTQNLLYSIKNRVAHQAISIMAHDPDLARMYAQCMIGDVSVPTTQQQMYNRWLNGVLSQMDGMSDADKYAMTQFFSQNSAYTVINSMIGTSLGAGSRLPGLQ